jgi:hypothetical protein
VTVGENLMLVQNSPNYAEGKAGDNSIGIVMPQIHGAFLIKSARKLFPAIHNPTNFQELV